MPKNAPPVRDFMSRLPDELSVIDTLSAAQTMMQRGQHHHVPVMDGTKLVGIISSRDVEMLTALLGITADEHTLGTLCKVDPYTVSPVTPITAVVRGMMERRIGSAVVVDGDVVVGIFTTTDAMSALIAAYD